MPDPTVHTSTPSCKSFFRACINGRPLQLKSLLGRLTLRPELQQAPNHWIWKVIADGLIGKKRISIGLFFDEDLQPGTYTLIDNPRIKVVYNEAPHCRSLIYHSRQLQSGSFTLLEIDRQRGHLQGLFDFGIAAFGFEVRHGHFNLSCSKAHA